MDTVASEEDLQNFARLPQQQRKLTQTLRGVLAETAATGLIRYRWEALQPLVAWQLNRVLEDLHAESQVEVGPPAPLPDNETFPELQARLLAELAAFVSEAPFTMQRLCELLLEAQKQYHSLPKLALAVERLLMVTLTVPHAPDPPPRPPLSSLPPINETPAPAASYFGQGAVPNGVDPHVHATSSHNEAANVAERNFGLASAAVTASGPTENGPQPMDEGTS
ncbi:hypothetical protein WJX84_009246 [Apatococcus fuscideae]|uniref:Serine/threonine-protein phosphatase 4 regulatory subunit 2 n=1 Tax=Apatococcus fuscideae TaxID=2026836 RepID=A0AAW1SRQ6_9CHLO